MGKFSTFCCTSKKAEVINFALFGLFMGLMIFANGAYFFLTSPRVENTDSMEKQGMSKEDQQLADAILKLAMRMSGAKLLIGTLNVILSTIILKGVIDRKPAQLRVCAKLNICTWTFVCIVLLILDGVAVVAGIDGFSVTAVLSFIVHVAWEGYYVYRVHKYADLMEGEDKPVQGVVIADSGPDGSIHYNL